MGIRQTKRNSASRAKIAITALSVLAFSAMCTETFAHDLYLLPDHFFVDAGMLLRVALNDGDSFPVSEVSPIIERVRDMQIVSLTSKWDVIGLHVAGNSVEGTVQISPRDGVIATARTIPHAFELPAVDFEKYLKEEGLLDVIAWRRAHGQSNVPGRERYSKYAKALLANGRENEFHTHPVGFSLEFVPEKSPYGLDKGAGMPLRLLYKGMPARNVQVESSWATPDGEANSRIVGRTDAEGRIVVPLGKSGKWRIHAVKMDRCNDTKVADWESSWASLTFQVQ
jgi:hypothetical protein